MNSYTINMTIAPIHNIYWLFFVERDFIMFSVETQQ